MLRKPIPFWVLGFGFLLAAVAGWINAIGLLGFRQEPVSHMSGNLTTLGLMTGLEHWPRVLSATIVITAFFAGSALAGFIIRNPALTLGLHYGSALWLECGIIGAAMVTRPFFPEGGEMLLALACGLQNGLASSYSGSVIRTTHVTGMITDLGIASGQWLRGLPVDRRKFTLYGTLLGGFWSGAVGGAAAFSRWGDAALWGPAVGVAIAGTAAFYAQRAGPDRVKI